MSVRPCVVEVVDHDDKVAALKQLSKGCDLDLLVGIQDCRILLAKDRKGKSTIGGLVFFEQKSLSRVVIKWIYVAKLWRKLSVARSLIECLECDCCGEGVSVIVVTFDRQNCGMNGLFDRSYGWSTCSHLEAYTFSVKAALAPALIKGEAAVQKRGVRARIEPLSECHDQDVLRASKAKDLPQWAQLDESILSQANREFSRVFYLKGCIVGWLITVPLAVDTLEYRILWVDPEHRHTGVMVKALADVMRAAHLQEGNALPRRSSDFCSPWGKGFFMVHAGNQQMISWVKKRLTQGACQKASLILREKSVDIVAAG